MSETAVAAAATIAPGASVPLGVEEIIEHQLRLYNEQCNKEEAFREGNGSTNTGLQHKSTPMELLRLPPAVAAQHRVQLTVRGRRYETAMNVAVAYCLTFYAFFHCPFDGSKTVGDVAVADDGETKGVLALSEQALLRHYIAVVEPLLLSFLQQQQEQHTVQTGAHSTVGTADSVDAHCSKEGLTFFPPALPRPRCVSYDAVGHLWKFEFPPRLTAEAEAQERDRRQRLATSTVSSASEKHITSDDMNASPFLLLQSDFMGVLLVYLRRCEMVRAEAASAARTPAGEKAAAYPALPIRWKEMNYDEQVSFLQLLRTFGVVSLTSVYVQPSAPLSTSRFVGADAARVAAEGNACSLHVQAGNFVAQQQPEVREVETHSTHKSSTVDDFADLVLAANGCARCGMAGHATEECRY